LIFTSPLEIVLTVNAVEEGRDLDANDKCSSYNTIAPYAILTSAPNFGGQLTP